MELTFERLEAWRKARDLAGEIYRLVGNFPREEKYGLSEQLRRAAVSIPSNLAEGSGRETPAEKLRFSSISYGSLMEVICQMILAVDFGYASQDEIDPIREKA